MDAVQNADRATRHAKLLKAASELITVMEATHAHPDFATMWKLYTTLGHVWKGPRYGAQLATLKQLVTEQTTQLVMEQFGPAHVDLAADNAAEAAVEAGTQAQAAALQTPETTFSYDANGSPV